MPTLTPKTSRWVEGKTIRRVVVETIRDSHYDAPVHSLRRIEFTDGTFIFANVAELEPDYAVELYYQPKRER